MRLGKIPDRDPKRRLNISLRSSVLTRMHQYRAFYRENYGSDIDVATVIEEILNDYITSDKDFMKSPASRRRINLDDPTDTGDSASVVDATQSESD